MAKQLSSALNIDLPTIAKMLERKGRGKDTILAHITPKEAALLKARGGRGSRNPDTGLLEFEPDFENVAPEVSPQDYSLAAGGTQPGFGLTAEGGGAQGLNSPSISSSPPPENFQVSGQGLATPQTPSGGYDYYGTNYGIAQPDYSSYGLQQQGPSAYGLQPTSGTSPYATALQQTPTPYSLTGGDQATQSALADQAKTPEEKSMLSRLLGKLDSSQLLRLGLTGGLGLLGASRSRQAANQIEAAQNQQQTLAQPYQTQGQALTGAAQRGELSPSSLQAYKAAQAQLAQGVASSGGVGSQQAATQLEALRQQLLSNQYNYGIQVSQIGDNIALGAIRTGMQLDQQLNAASNSFYASLASFAAGLPMTSTAQTTSSTTTV